MSGAICPTCFGLFCPADPAKLSGQVELLLRSVPASVGSGICPKAIIAPHAGYDYSGPIAAAAYARLVGHARSIHRVILLGTCHAARIQGMVTTTAAALQTPLGEVAIDQSGVARALEFSTVRLLDAAHEQDHALAVQLPFLQAVLDTFSVVPLLVGPCEASDVAAVCQPLWQGDDLLVVSSDLSHYHDYETARRIDAASAASILALDAEGVFRGRACGYPAIGGLLLLAKRRGLTARQVDLRNSGDTAGSRDRVVGYGAFAFE